jgi:hypothetical protein
MKLLRRWSDFTIEGMAKDRHCREPNDPI